MRSIRIFAILALTISGCSPSSEERAATNADMVRTYFELFNTHQWNAMAAMYADTAEFLDPSFGPHPVRQSRAQIEVKYAGLEQMIPDIRDDVQQILPSGDRQVTVQFVSRGTAPDGSVFELPICTIFTIENGLITRDHTYYDNSAGPKDH